MPEALLAGKPGNKDQNKLYGLDHLRAFAITYVFIFHYRYFGHPDWEPALGKFGWTGVDLFFVLSGFLIAGQLFSAVAKGKPIPLREFFTKRFFRIIPPFLVVLFIYFAFPYAREWGKPSPLWRYLTFTLNFNLDLKKYSTFSHAWSLCVEEQFYLILPLCFWLFTYFKAGTKAVYLIAFLFIAGFVLRIWCWDNQVAPLISSGNMRALWNQYVYYPTYNRLDGLLTGVSIAGLFTFYPQIKNWANRYNVLLMLTGLLGLVAAYFVCADRESFNTGTYGFLVVSLAYGLILAAFVSPANILYRVKSKVTSLIATLSYSLYLVHKIVIHLTQTLLAKAGMDINSTLMMLICITTSIAAALLMRYAVEKPALKLRDRVLSNWKRKKGKETELAGAAG